MSLRTVVAMRYVTPLREGSSLPAIAEADEDLCFLTKTPIEDVLAKVAGRAVERVSEIVDRTGAVGALRSISLRDPDGNVMEPSNAVAS